MRERPDIGKMIEEELAKEDAEGAKPLETKEFSPEAPRDEVDDAFEKLTEKGAEGSADAAKVADLGGEAAKNITQALGKGEKNLGGLVEAYVAEAAKFGKSKAEAVTVLQEQLKGFHDGYFGADQKERAAEINAFSRSLDARSDVSTDAGKDFLSRLDAGEFSSIEDANAALDGIAKGAKGKDAEALTAEFNVLFAKAQEKLLGGKSAEGGLDASDDDIDRFLSGVG